MIVPEQRELARIIHEARMAYCWGKYRAGRDPWPDKLPGDFGYVPQSYVDIAFAQAAAVLEGIEYE